MPSRRRLFSDRTPPGTPPSATAASASPPLVQPTSPLVDEARSPAATTPLPPPPPPLEAWAEEAADEQPSPPALPASPRAFVAADEDALDVMPVSPARFSESDDPPPPRESTAVAPATASSAASSAATQSRLPAIPPALLALPRPVLAAAMRQRPPPPRAAPPHPPHQPSPPPATGQSGPVACSSSSAAATTTAAAERQARTARRQWLEQAKLLQQRAALLAKDFLPQAALAEHGVAEAVAPVLAEVASRARARAEEAASLTSARERAAELCARFGSLVAHIGAGGEFLDELRMAMEGAEAELSGLRARRATSLEQLALEEREAEEELHAITRRLDAWADDDAAAHAAHDAPPPPRTTPMTTVASRVRLERRASAAAQGTPSPPPACGLVGGREGDGVSGVGRPHPSSPSAAPSPPQPPGSRTPSDASGSSSAMHAEVARLDGFLARLGGTDCGWDAEDHAAYLRLRTQALGAAAALASPLSPRSPLPSDAALAAAADAALPPRVAVLVDRAAREIPGHDAASVASHERVLRQREAALERRRQLLVEWREAKRTEAHAARTAAAREVAAAAEGGAPGGVAGGASHSSSCSSSRLGGRSKLPTPRTAAALDKGEAYVDEIVGNVLAADGISMNYLVKCWSEGDAPAEYEWLSEGQLAGCDERLATFKARLAAAEQPQPQQLQPQLLQPQPQPQPPQLPQLQQPPQLPQLQQPPPAPAPAPWSGDSIATLIGDGLEPFRPRHEQLPSAPPSLWAGTHWARPSDGIVRSDPSDGAAHVSSRPCMPPVRVLQRSHPSAVPSAAPNAVPSGRSPPARASPMAMHCLSLRQPYASLLLNGVKTLETRSGVQVCASLESLVDAY